MRHGAVHSPSVPGEKFPSACRQGLTGAHWVFLSLRNNIPDKAAQRPGQAATRYESFSRGRLICSRPWSLPLSRLLNSLFS